MTTRRAGIEVPLAALSALLFAGCTSPQVRVASLRADTRLAGGGESLVKMEVPGTWFQSASKPDRADFLAPDNFSRATVSSIPVLASDRCVEIAQRAARDAVTDLLKGKKDVRADLKSAPESPEVVDFSAVVPGNPPGPSDRAVAGRVICRDGALAVATCSAGVERPDNRDVCQKALGTLRVEPLGQVTKQEVPEGMDHGPK